MDPQSPFTHPPADRGTRNAGARPAAVRAPALTVQDIYYVLFRQKWKIFFCAFLGVVAAAAVFSLKRPPYRSEAKLFIRYVMDNKTSSPGTVDARVRMPDERGENIVSSEVEILTSFDLARQVVEKIGPDKILEQEAGSTNYIRAALQLNQDIEVEALNRSSVIRIAFQHPDKTLVQPVLEELIDRYFKRHVSIHRSAGTMDGVLAKQTDELRAQLMQTEEQLRQAIAATGAISIEDARLSLSQQASRLRQELFDREAELVERQTLLRELAHPAAAVATSAVAVAAEPVVPLDEYRNICLRIELWRRRQQELLGHLTEQSTPVREIEVLITRAETQKRNMEREFPQLITLLNPPLAPSAPPDTLPGRPVDIPTETARIRALESRIRVLKTQFEDVRAEAAKIDASELAIAELQRRKQMEEANLRYFTGTLEQARFEDALGAGKLSNISLIQSPSPARRSWTKTFKLMFLLMVGGIMSGLGIAFFVELKLDRTLRRPGDVEGSLRLPLFMSIPRLSRRKLLARPPHLRELAAAGGGGATDGESGVRAGQLDLLGWQSAPALVPFHEALRDRLISQFEALNMSHKPKLVAVTSAGHQAGVSTTAAGLAASLSETGDGNVLLVDMNPRGGVTQQFARGRPVGGLADALRERPPALLRDNLYVVNEGAGGSSLRFTQLVPKLKMSDYDYVIFDMPPVSQTSVTARLAKYMDLMVLLVESERTDRGIAQRALALLAESKTNVYAVLNKVRPYVPRRLSSDLPSES